MLAASSESHTDDNLDVCRNRRSPAFAKLKRMLLVLGVLGISSLVVAGFYSHPSADDFSYSALTHVAAQSGNIFSVFQAAVSTTLSFMESWQGLYSSAFVLSLQPSIFSESLYALTCPLLLLVSLASFMVFFRSVSFHILASRSRAWVGVACVTWFFFVQTMPSPIQGLYWYNGAMNYLLFWALGLVTISLMIGYYASENRTIGSWVRLVCATVLAFLVAGGNHVSSFGCILTLLLIAGVCVWKKRRFEALLPLIVCIVGFAIVMTAPGTAIRTEALSAIGVERSIPWTLVKAPYSVLVYLNEWIGLSFACFLGATAPFAYRMLRSARIDSRIFSIRNTVLVGGASFLFLTAVLCVPLYSLHGLGEGRLTDIVYASFVVLSAVTFCMLLATIMRTVDAKHLQFLSVQSTGAAVGFALLFAFIFVLPSTWTDATLGIMTGAMAEYDAQLDARQELYRDESARNVVVPALTTKPSLIYFDDITNDPTDWRNVSVAAFYGKESIVLEQSGDVSAEQ